MAVPSHINSKYSAIIFEDTDELIKARAADPISQGFLENISINTSGPKGLNVGGKVTEVPLDDSSWTPLPSTPLENRNAIAIQNKSGSEIKINYLNTTVGYEGIVIDDGGERQYDITDNIIIYAKSEAGTTPTIYVEELA